MRKIVILSLLCGLWTSLTHAANGHKIRIELSNYDGQACILAYNRGSKLLVQDTADFAQGVVTFSDQEALFPGVYSVVSMPDTRQIFQFIVTKEQQHFTLAGDAKQPNAAHIKVTGSPANQAFMPYMARMVEFGKRMQQLNNKIQTADANQQTQFRKEMLEAERAHRNFQIEYMNQHKGSLLGALIGASLSPDVPDNLRADKAAAYYFVKAHHFEHFDWSAEGLIRSPMLESKMMHYIDKLTPTNADSLKTAVDYIIKMAKEGGNERVYQYCVSELLNKYVKPRTICVDDALYVHIAEKYYCSGEVDWVDEKQLKNICRDAADLKRTLCGSPARDFVLKTVDNLENYRLSSTFEKENVNFVILYFWDPNCGNCAKATKKLNPIYEKYKDQGVEIIGICSDPLNEVSKCQQAVKDKGMQWVNLTGRRSYTDEEKKRQVDLLPIVKKTYNLKMTPTLFIIDKNKRIIWNRINAEQIEDILKREIEKLEQEG